jgi:glycine cleavage system H lipoate-binding protein
MESRRLNTRFRKTNPQCIWMQAGVARRRFCDMDYDCTKCRFDRIMRRTAREKEKRKEAGENPRGRRWEIVSWKKKLMARPVSGRPCIHHMKGRIEFRACTQEYRCGDCELDQYFCDQYFVHAVVEPVGVLEVDGFKIPQGYYFHPGHTWARVEEGSSVRVGMDAFALCLLGPLDGVEAPLMGKEVKQGRADISVTRGEKRARVLSPVSGVVTSINPRLREEGRRANEDPYTEGWIMRVHANNLRQDLKALMINQETGDFVKAQVERLYRVIEETGGPLTADGGDLGTDIYGSMSQLGWERLTNIFLGT